jgi:hypothetical protein
MGYREILAALCTVENVGLNTIKISPLNENEATLIDFQKLVVDVRARSFGGYVVAPHKTDMWNLPGKSVVYDYAIITRTS